MARFLIMPEFPIHGSKYFDVREFVDNRTWQLRGIKAAELIDPKIVAVCDLLREHAGPLTVNNWHTKGKYKSSGFRAVWDNTGGVLSQHRCGRAADVKSKKYKPGQLLSIIMQHKAEFMAAGLTCIESLQFTPTWLHLDCRYTGLDDLVFVQP